MRFRVYTLTNSRKGISDDILIREVCHTNSESIASFAVKEEAETLGKGLYVLLIADGELRRATPGKHGDED